MTRARAVREAAKLTPEAVAKRLRVKPEYLLKCEREGFPLVLAQRAAPVYGCGIGDFLNLKEGRKDSSRLAGAVRPGKMSFVVAKAPRD